MNGAHFIDDVLKTKSNKTSNLKNVPDFLQGFNKLKRKSCGTAKYCRNILHSDYQ